MDIESDGLLPELSKIHCIVMKDIDTQKVFAWQWLGSAIDNSLEMLENASEIVGHNALTYDVPAIQKLYPRFKPKGKVTDTLILSRLCFPSLYERDAGNNDMEGLSGKHSLKAWGKRLGILKGDFSEQTDWKEFTESMLEYCLQDVLVLERLYQYLLLQKPSDMSVFIEHEFAKIIHLQTTHGCPFNITKFDALVKTLEEKFANVKKELQAYFPVKKTFETVIPTRTNKKLGMIKGQPYVKEVVEEINFGSRDQLIAYFKKKYEWKPESFTFEGNVKLDDDVLSRMTYPEAKSLLEYFETEKLLAKLRGSDKAFASNIKKQEDGSYRIYGGMITNGAISGRCTHLVVSNIPRPGSPFGEELRALFTAKKDEVMVGCDAKGLELRTLAHYMADYDNGEFAKLVVHGDAHEENRKEIDKVFPCTRNTAKTFIFALIYGAGQSKLGLTLDPKATNEGARNIGKRARERIMMRFPALNRLTNLVKSTFNQRKYLKGLDGRMLTPRADYAALNVLCQSAGAVIMKLATIKFWEEAEKRGWKFGEDVTQLLHVHDEYSFSCKKEISEQVASVARHAIQYAGKQLELKCEMDGESKIGNDWLGCH